MLAFCIMALIASVRASVGVCGAVTVMLSVETSLGVSVGASDRASVQTYSII